VAKGALSEGDAKAVLVLLEAIEPVFLDALSKLSMKAPEFVRRYPAIFDPSSKFLLHYIQRLGHPSVRSVH
jgi:hypothetical protein